MTTVACDAKSKRKEKSCLRNLIQCCCSCGSQKKTEIETVEIYQSHKNPFESDISLITQGSCDEHVLKPKMRSVNSQTDGSYNFASSGDQMEVSKPHNGDGIVNCCQTTAASNIELKSDCPSLTDEMIKKDNQELVETILAKYLEYKYQESLIKQEIMEEQQQQLMEEQQATTVNFAYCHCHHEKKKSQSQDSSAIDSNDPSDGELKEKSNVASSSNSVELPEKSRSEPANCENCMHSKASSLDDISKSDSYIMLNDENKKLELVFLPSSSTELCTDEAVNELDSSKSIQYKISCPDHEQSFARMKENDNIQNGDELKSKSKTKSSVCDFHYIGSPSVVKWKLFISSQPDLPPDS